MAGKRKRPTKAVEIAPEGELTIYQAHELRELFSAALKAPGAAVECDLSGVSEMDTVGFQLLVQLKRECVAEGRDLHLKRHSEAVLEVLSLYCAEQYFGDPLLLSKNTGTSEAGSQKRTSAP